MPCVAVSAGRIVIVGAGIVGLKIADLLTLDGVTDRFDVEVRYDGPLLASASMVAGGLVEPAASGDERVLGSWFRQSLCAWKEEVRTRAGWGVQPVTVRHLGAAAASPPPWAEHAPDLRPLTPAEVPAAYAGTTGFAWSSFVVQPNRYLPRLAHRLKREGVVLRRCPVPSLDELPDADLVVNAAGAWSGALAGDPTVHAVRGDVAVLPEVQGVTGAVIDESEWLYVVAHQGRTIVGGTSIDLGADPAAWVTSPPADRLAAVIERAAILEPRIAGGVPDAVHTGLRPLRPTLRTEVEQRGTTPVVHAYGTGGSGWTIAPALARWAVDAVKARLGVPPHDWVA